MILARVVLGWLLPAQLRGKGGVQASCPGKVRKPAGLPFVVIWVQKTAIPASEPDRGT